jgi:phosphatidylserine/phosphatidylglycerophosphate/cardiolipin synthase-like enzyme
LPEKEAKMRTPILTSTKGLQVRGVAGTYVVLLAFNCSKDYCDGLLGFGIQRKDHENGEVIWLRGMKKFDLPDSDEGDDVSTRHHPIQKFHWGDYTTKPGRTYTYTIHAMKGKPGALVDFDSIDVNVTCETPGGVGVNGHAVHFNRSAAASQAFAKRFPNLPPGDVVDPNARTWLSRGLAESLIGFIDATQPGEGLHLFVYEFEKDEFLAALKRALDRKVRLEILYDAILHPDSKDKKKKTGPSLESKTKIEKFGLKEVCRGRTGSGLNISHNKFMVRTDINGNAQAVWTGSTNFTDSGIYGQANVGHIVANAKLAQTYFNWHQEIWKASDSSVTSSRKIAMQLTIVPAGQLNSTTLVLSPRANIEAVKECARRVTEAKRMVCFTAPFALHDELENALVKAPAQVFGLLNKDSVVGKELHNAPNTQLAAAGAIDEKSVLEVWQGKLHAESMKHSGVYIHTKIIMVDPLSENPIIVTGSANFSNNSSKNNDENQLFISDEKEVADVYLGEFMRMFDHYYFRDHLKWVAKEQKVNPKVRFLDDTNGWTLRFFDSKEREAMRLAFFA